jgi:hypothetical protein
VSHRMAFGCAWLVCCGRPTCNAVHHVACTVLQRSTTCCNAARQVALAAHQHRDSARPAPFGRRVAIDPPPAVRVRGARCTYARCNLARRLLHAATRQRGNAATPRATCRPLAALRSVAHRRPCACRERARARRDVRCAARFGNRRLVVARRVRPPRPAVRVLPWGYMG